jgi:transcriptional regulator with XRE-family HTH domain
LHSLGATLRQYRKQRHLSQQALAARTGLLDDRYLSQIELGRHNISVLMLLHLAYALEIPAACLLAWVDTSAPYAPPTTGALLASREVRDVAVSHDDTPSVKPGDAATLLPLLGATIRQYRHQLGLSQQALAARTGLNPTYIGQIEHGHRNLSVLSLVRIADALGISLSSLLTPLETR